MFRKPRADGELEVGNGLKFLIDQGHFTIELQFKLVSVTLTSGVGHWSWLRVGSRTPFHESGPLRVRGVRVASAVRSGLWGQFAPGGRGRGC